MSDLVDVADVTDIEFAYLCDVGEVRQSNEDYVRCEDNLCVLADGLGRRYNGACASAKAVNTVLDEVKRGRDLVDAIGHTHRLMSQPLVNDANMGTTIVACEFTGADAGARYQVAWVGDSRAYLWDTRQAALTQLTDDHSLVNLWVKRGQLTPESAEQHPKRNVLTQCLGLSDSQTLQIGSVHGRFDQHHIMLLCSDGLTKMVSHRVLTSILKQALPLEQLAKELVVKANDLGGIDNVSVALARLT